MKYKATLFILVLFCLRSITSCTSCCENVAYYDYTSMTVWVEGDSTITKDSLFIYLSPSDLYYLASYTPNLGFETVLATSCNEGSEGMKFPIKNVEITSNANFNDQYSTGEDLANLFQIKKPVPNTGISKFFPLPEQDELQGENFLLLLTERPTEDSIHQFTFKLTKSDNTVMTMTTETVRWQ
jgi:hypothetical protein